MVVGQGVEHGLPLPAGLDQADVFQRPELVRDGGLGHPQQGGDVAHAHLRGEEGVQDADPSGVPKDPEQLRQVIEGILVRQGLGHLAENVLVGLGLLTAVHRDAVGHRRLLVL